MNDYTRLLRVGAQKSGISWLHRYLLSPQECGFRSDDFNGDIPVGRKPQMADALT